MLMLEVQCPVLPGQVLNRHCLTWEGVCKSTLGRCSGCALTAPGDIIILGFHPLGGETRGKPSDSETGSLLGILSPQLSFFEPLLLQLALWGPRQALLGGTDASSLVDSCGTHRPNWLRSASTRCFYPLGY